MKSIGLGICLLCASATAFAAPVNTLSWKVSNEDGVFGYIVYRAEQRSGPFLRIGPGIVRKDRTAHEPATATVYRFEDTGVSAGRTYYYFVDVIATSGIKQRLTGVQARTVPAP